MIDIYRNQYNDPVQVSLTSKFATVLGPSANDGLWTHREEDRPGSMRVGWSMHVNKNQSFAGEIGLH